MNLKGLLKFLKLNESTISTGIGVIVILVLGVLVINYFRNLPTGQTFPDGITTEKEDGKDANQEGSYTVKEGDSLWTIAEQELGSGYDWIKIADINNLENPSSIEAGQTITLPSPAEASSEEEMMELSQEEPTLTPTPSKAEESMQMQDEPTKEEIVGNTYTVMRGDSLWKIAQQVYGDGYKWVEIAQANNLDNPDIIHAGNILSLPQIGK